MQIKEGQTILDAAIQGTGDAATALQIAINADGSLTDDLEPGQDLATPGAAIDKTATVELMNKPSNLPASTDNYVQGQGIGYWRIGIDFKVS